VTNPVIKKMAIVGAYYDDVKKAIVLRGNIEGVDTEFQLPLHESDFSFPKHCIDKELEMKKTAELFDARKGSSIDVQFDGGSVNGSS
jgi:hypothetical protein